MIHAIACAVLLLANTPDTKLHEQCLYPTVKVTITDGAGNALGCGSGFIIDSKHIGGGLYRNAVLTNAHVAKRNNIQIDLPIYTEHSVFKEFKTYSCSMFLIDEKRDLSIIVFISHKELDIVEISRKIMHVGLEVYRTGCGGGEEPRLDYGQITSVNYEGNKWRTNVYTVKGDSGGPLFHDYKVVAIAYAIKMERGPVIPHALYNISAYIPITDFLDWKKESPQLRMLLRKTTKTPEVIVPSIEKIMPDTIHIDPSILQSI